MNLLWIFVDFSANYILFKNFDIGFERSTSGTWADYSENIPIRLHILLCFKTVPVFVLVNLLT